MLVKLCHGVGGNAAIMGLEGEGSKRRLNRREPGLLVLCNPRNIYTIYSL